MQRINFLPWVKVLQTSAALAHAMAGNEEYLSKLIEGNSGFAEILSLSCKSLEGYSENKWDEAREELETASSDLNGLAEVEPADST